MAQMRRKDALIQRKLYTSHVLSILETFLLYI